MKINFSKKLTKLDIHLSSHDPLNELHLPETLEDLTIRFDRLDEKKINLPNSILYLQKKNRKINSMVFDY